MVTVADYRGRVRPDWCPACGNFAQLSAISGALTELSIAPKDVVVVSGIGCSSNMPEFINTYGFHGLHGRLLPVASAIKWANPKLTVIAYGGDGDGFFEGTQHFYHSAKRNINIKYIVSDNQTFGLTTGQASPTAPLGRVTKSTPFGNPEKPVNPLTFALSAGATFVARGFSGDTIFLKEIIKKAIMHKGFAFVDVFSPCVTYNKIETYDYLRQRVYKLDTDVTDFDKAYKHAQEEGDRLPTGVFYDVTEKIYDDYDPVISKESLNEVPPYKFTEKTLEEFL
ncbi:MAG: thiamine pyrophosphate-dependent enzyme [Thermoplasmatales archaeon]|nr:thiamine pyrophosphate-dependent enzyme [Thermoplasmatales archaeon]MCW6170009.1 thiamine pyrophosphate-dependent enzyme [Thermoplasmatales archaeon]